MPTAVLMMIGQIAVMKITKIADGWPSRNAASDSGSQASGGTVRSTWKIGSRPRIAQIDWPTSVPSATPTIAASAKPSATRCRLAEQVPEQALVDAAAVEERIDDQLPGVLQHLRAAAAASRPALRQSNLPDEQHQRDARSAAATTLRRDALRRALQPISRRGRLRRASGNDLRRCAGAAARSRFRLRASGMFIESLRGVEPRGWPRASADRQPTRLIARLSR